MSLKNTAENYGLIAKWFHWGTAVLFLFSYAFIYYEIWFTPRRPPPGVEPDPVYWFTLQVHLSIGMTLFVLIALRIFWNFMNRNMPAEEPGTKLEHWATRAGHYALYAIMIIMPLTGYVGTGNDTHFFFLFNIPRFQDTPLFSLIGDNLGMTFEELEVYIDFVHKQLLGIWVTPILLAVHVSAALWHHYGKKDRTIYKMTNNKNHPEINE